MNRVVLCTLLCLSVHTQVVSGDNWPCWRGPQGDGTSTESRVPTRWNGKTGENIAWKVAVPGTGHASPVIWEDRIFLASCVEDQKKRILLCLQKNSGKEVWRADVVESVLETKHRLNSFASGTPATDGKLVYVSYLVTDGTEVPAKNVGTARPTTTGEMLVAAYDFDGRQKWITYPGAFTSVHGYCSSPVIYKDLIIVNGDHDGESYIVALDKKTGATRWKVPREYQTRSYCTPLIRNINGQDQMVLSGSKRIVSYDPATGREIWKVEGPTEQFVASMVFDGRQFYMAAGFPTHHVMAIRPDGKGDVTESHVSWHSTDAKCYVPSPVVVDHYLFVADDRGTVNCFNTRDGSRIWRDRLGVHYSASLITAGGLVYFTADDGITKVVRPGPSPAVIAENPLGDFAYASSAVSDGRIYIRSERSLYAIGTNRVASASAPK